MVEAGASEVSEAEVLDALDIAHEAIKQICAAQLELREKLGKPKVELEAPFVDHDLIASIKASHGADLDKALETRGKLELQDAIGAVKDAVVTQYAGTPDADDYAAKAAGARRRSPPSRSR